MKLDIVKYGSPVLRQKSQPVARVTPDLVGLAQDMLDTMHAAKGVGLAAQQIGRLESVCVIDVPESCEDDDETRAFNAAAEMPLVMFNPEVVKLEGEAPGREGCLSFPGVGGDVTRAAEATVQFRDISGAPRILTVRGFLARAVQHETDHLNGILYVDRMTDEMRKTKQKKLDKLSGKNGGVV